MSCVFSTEDYLSQRQTVNRKLTNEVNETLFPSHMTNSPKAVMGM